MRARPLSLVLSGVNEINLRKTAGMSPSHVANGLSYGDRGNLNEYCVLAVNNEGWAEMTGVVSQFSHVHMELMTSTVGYTTWRYDSELLLCSTCWA
jgi:hypothetical protein